MNPNRQTTGGFLRSSFFSIAIIANLLFSLAFVLSLSFHIVKTKESLTPVYKEKPLQEQTDRIAVLADIQQ